ncbi:MAG: CRISPR system precrRNA processing endoribonuclease RAMP protein Cas6 [Chloroflexi bacterium]|nr:CRISPR system precrRNA processing endoribonuclease RAMP protein Cas6 [Chloroflexota bacterium]
MDAFSVTCLRYTVEALTPVQFGSHAGAQLRGGLYHELSAMAHTRHEEQHDPRHLAICPVCRMMNRENPGAARGRTVPRPFGVLPPLAADPQQPPRYATGEQFTFGLNLYGETDANYQLLTLAVQRLGQTGVGFGRGQFLLHRIEQVQSLTGTVITLLDTGTTTSRLPESGVQPAAIRDYAENLPADHLTLRFVTPTRLIERGKLVHTPEFAPLLARLLERLEALEAEYANGERWVERYQTLTHQAASVELHTDQTQWVELRSGSRRQNRTLPLSGFVGEATYTGDLAPFREWLAWGSLVQVGKNVVKGCGWYKIVR